MAHPPAKRLIIIACRTPPLDRTQQGLPLKKGRAGTMTHDYKRHGTTTLFAAFDVLEGLRLTIRSGGSAEIADIGARRIRKEGQ